MVNNSSSSRLSKNRKTVKGKKRGGRLGPYPSGLVPLARRGGRPGLGGGWAAEAGLGLGLLGRLGCAGPQQHQPAGRPRPSRRQPGSGGGDLRRRGGDGRLRGAAEATETR